MSRKNLKKIIESITSELKSSTGLSSYYFGEDASQDNGNESSESNLLSEIFSDHLRKFSEEFGNFGVEIDDLRSTVLPVSTVNAISGATDVLASEISRKSDDKSGSTTKISYQEHLFEPYENAFLRMMGMPSEKDLYGKDVLIIEDSNAVVKKEGEDFSFEDIFQRRNTSSIDRVSHQRSQKILFLSASDRALNYLSKDEMSIVNKIKDKTVKFKNENADDERFTDDPERGRRFLFKYFLENLAEEDAFKNLVDDSIEDRVFESPFQEDLETYFDYKVMNKKEERVSLINYEKYILSEAALLFPPVQDSRIEYCLSEPSKIVSKPFDFGRATVNREPVKTSLLESVIRIRLDSVTGFRDTGNRKGKKSTQDLDLGGFGIADESENALAFSVIEKIIINRLGLALENFAEAFYDLTENYFKVCKKARTTLEEIINVESQVKTKTLTDFGSASNDNVDEIRKLTLLKEIDDTILILLEKNKEMTREFGSFRTTNINDDVSMSTLIKLITVPSSYANEKIQAFKKMNRNAANGNGGILDTSAKIAQMMGLHRGVGLLDLICFSIAFFTSDIEDLVGLLSKQQQKKLKSELGSRIGFTPNDMDVALINVSNRIVEAYNLFKENLKD